MAEIKDLTIFDFVTWCKQQVDLGELSTLVSGFGYTDDGVDTIAEALQTDKAFKVAFGKLLRKSLSAKKSYHEMQRASGELSSADWVSMAKKQSFSKADGAKPWWLVVMDVIGGVGSSISNAITPQETPAQTAARLAKEAAAAKAQATSSTFLWIILAVVIIAVVVILWLSTRKK